MQSPPPTASGAPRQGGAPSRADDAPATALEPRPTILIAVAMTALAELVYLVGFGFMAFPGGDVAAMIVWTATCAVAIGATVGAAVLVFAPRRGRPGAVLPFAAMAVIGVYCTLLCAWLDARFGLFGGDVRPALFILSGAVPAVIGGAIYAWLLNADAAAGLRRAFGGQP